VHSHILVLYFSLTLRHWPSTTDNCLKIHMTLDRPAKKEQEALLPSPSEELPSDATMEKVEVNEQNDSNIIVQGYYSTTNRHGNEMLSR